MTLSRAGAVVRWGVVVLGVWNAGRATILWRQMDWLVELPLAPDPRVRLALALIWSVFFFASALYLRRCAWVQRATPFLIAAFGVTELGMIARFATDSLSLLPVIVFVAFVIFAFRSLRPRAVTERPGSHSS